jgi:hypothetical protein
MIHYFIFKNENIFTKTIHFLISKGESGYIRIRSGSNVCGVESQPFYPIV